MYKLLLFFSLFFVLSNAQESLLEKAERHLYSNQDSAYHYLDKLFVESIENNVLIDALEASTYKNSVSAYHNNIQMFQTSLKQGEGVYNKIKDSIDFLPEGTYYENMHFYDKGNYYFKLRDYEKSSVWFFKLLNSLEKLPDSVLNDEYSDFLTVTNNFLATIYKKQLKYNIAQEFYIENLRLHTKFNHDIEDVLDTKNLIAALKSAQKEFDISNRYAKESIHYYLNNDVSNQLNSLMSTSILLVENYLSTNKLDSAEVYIKQIEPFLNKRPRFINDISLIQSKILFKKGNAQEAIHQYHAILKELITKQSTIDNATLVYKELGDIYLNEKNHKKALEYYDKGIELFDTNLSKKGTTDFIPKYKINLLKLLNASSSTLLKFDHSKNNSKVLKQGFITIRTLNTLKKTFYDEKDKQTLVENTLPIFENSIEAAFRLHEKTGDHKYIDTAFVFFEKSKGTILFDALLKNRASTFANISNELIEKEQILKLNIKRLEKKYHKNPNISSEELFNTKREYEDLLKNLEANYPDYYNLKYNNTVPSLKEGQKTLSSKDIILAYFTGENNVYLLEITNTDTALHKITTTSSDIENISSFIKALQNPKSNLDEINRVSNLVYEKFVKPAIFLQNKNNVLIIPDGILRTIPFEVLSSKKGSTGSYLIRDYTIRYINSIRLLRQLEKKESQNKKLLAFAPNFSNQFSTLPPLIHNTREAVNILTHFEGVSYTNDTATLQNFTKENPNYGIIHLATHAKVNDEAPEYSYLAFTPNKDEESFLYVNDLYAFRLNANLVTLSACETGLGQLKKGEGMLSLSRAFFYAGASSIAHSLWKVNDNTSSRVMENFYEYLAQGKKKDEALRLAKLDFLHKNMDTNLKHPYYWAGIIVSGNTNSIAKPISLLWIWLIPLLFILIITYLLYRKKKTN